MAVRTPMRAARQVPQTVAPLQREAQTGQQPDQEQAALVGLTITDHAHGVPRQAFPRVKVVGVAVLHAIAAVPELQVRRLGAKAPLRRPESCGQVVLAPGHHRPTHFSSGVQKRCGGKFSVDHHVIDPARSQAHPHATQQALPGSVFPVARPLGFHAHGQGEVATHHRRQDQEMAIADDLSVGMAVGTAPGALPLSPPPHRGAVQGQAHETTTLESLVALGAIEHRGPSGPRGRRI